MKWKKAWVVIMGAIFFENVAYGKLSQDVNDSWIKKPWNVASINPQKEIHGDLLMDFNEKMPSQQNIQQVQQVQLEETHEKEEKNHEGLRVKENWRLKDDQEKENGDNIESTNRKELQDEGVDENGLGGNPLALKMKTWSWQHWMWSDVWQPLGQQEHQKYELKKEDWRPVLNSKTKSKQHSWHWSGLPQWMGQWKQDSRNIKVSHGYNGLLSNIQWNAISQMKWDTQKGKTQWESAYVHVQWDSHWTWQAGQKKWNLAGETETRWGDSWAQGLGAAFKQDWWGGVVKTECSMLKPVKDNDSLGWNAKLAYKKGAWSPLYTWTRFEKNTSGINQVKEQQTYSVRYRWSNQTWIQWSFDQTRSDKSLANGSHVALWQSFN